MKNKRRFTSLLSLLLCAALLSGCGSSHKEASYAATAEEAYYDGGYAYDDYAAEAAEPMPAPAMNGIAASGSTAAKAESKGKLQAEKIIYSAYAKVETTEFEKTLEAVSEMVERFGGFVESSSISGASYYRSSRGMVSLRSADYTLRIPCEHFEELTGSLNELGSVPYCNTSSENVTASYYDVEARKNAYEAQEARLTEMLSIAESVEDLLAIQAQLSDVQYEIDALQSRLTNYDRQVSYSTVNLNVAEVEKYTEIPEVHLSYGEKLKQSFTGSCERVAEFLTDASLWLMGNLPELVLWAVILFVVVKLFRLIFRKRNQTERKSFRERRAERKAKRAAEKAAKAAAKNDMAPVTTEEGKRDE